jgi:hypothetical protein
MGQGLYVEARIRADMDELWDRTQRPEQHRRWDLRFTHIDYLERSEGEPQRFRYGVRVLPGLMVTGTGTAAGERHRPDGTRTSALRFASAHPLSLLAEGSGYWRYVPTPDGIRFLTGYDYEPRWGRTGRVADRLLFRPLMGWATAWSFDRLRLWLERGISPGQALRRTLAEILVRTLAVVATMPLDPALSGFFIMAALFLPPLPGTPAGRRCRRRRPEGVTAPVVLESLEQP